MEYKKHNYNIFPEMQQDDYNRLLSDLKQNGYDSKQPIYLYEGKIIDGWNRYKACKELNIEPVYTQFHGSNSDAILFIMRTNKRRNLTSSQWAAIAAEADEIWEVIEKQVEDERVKKLEGNKNASKTASQKAYEQAKEFNTIKTMVQLIVPSSEQIKPKDTSKLSTTRIAETFNTNRTYVSDAKKLRTEKPEVFERIKSGETTIAEVKKQEKNKTLEQKKQDYKESISKEIELKPKIKRIDCSVLLNSYDDDSIDCIMTDPPYFTDVGDIYDFVKWVDIAIQKTKKSGRLYICTGAYPKEIQAYLKVFLSQDKFIVDNPLIWTYKNTLGQTPRMKYNLNYQLIWHLYSKETPELDTSITNHMFSVQEINAPDGRLGDRLHTWQKPDELANRLVRQGTKENWSIVDPFACTGTFLLAGARQKRKAYGGDININNIQIALERGCEIDL